MHFVYEFDELFELLVGLSRKTGDHRRAEYKLRDRLPHHRNHFDGRLTRHSARHALEHRVARMLERHVDVGQDPLGLANGLQECSVDVHGIEIHQPNPI